MHQALFGVLRLGESPARKDSEVLGARSGLHQHMGSIGLQVPLVELGN